MKINVSKIQQILREEYSLKRNLFEEEQPEFDHAKFKKITAIYNNDPFKLVPHRVLMDAGIPVNTDYTYRVVYERIVAQKDGDDVAYWLENETVWRDVTDENREHPTATHSPVGRARKAAAQSELSRD